MTKTDVFFDTNVVVYAMVGDTLLADRSWTILRAGGTVSVQVLNECANTLRRKFSSDWPARGRGLRAHSTSCVTLIPLTEETHVRGLALAERYSLSVYDGMIVAAAQLAGCTILYTEDMHDGLVIDRLTIRNPYAAGR